MNGVKAILFDSGRTLNVPRTGHWFITPNFMSIIENSQVSYKEEQINRQWKKSVYIVCLILVFSFLMTSCNTVYKPVTQQVKEIKIDKNYLLALNSADKFLAAWLNRDYKSGAELLTEKVKSSINQEDLNMFFTGLSNPHHQGFEINGKEYVNENTIRFQVWLYVYYTGETPASTERPASYSFDVVKVNENTWLVNNLPQENIK